MRSTNHIKAEARKVVSERLRSFIAMQMDRFTTSPTELWHRMEIKSAVVDAHLDEHYRGA